MAWKNYPKKRVPRWQKQQEQSQTQSVVQQEVPLTDANGNGYPDAYEAQEDNLLQQIANRRMAYGYKKEINAYGGIGSSGTKSKDGISLERQTLKDILR